MLRLTLHQNDILRYESNRVVLSGMTVVIVFTIISILVIKNCRRIKDLPI